VRLRWRPEQVTEAEWMDAPGHSLDVIADNLNDLRRVNRALGGVRLTLRPLQRLAGSVPADETLRVLDVATGGADIPRAIAGWAAHSGRRVLLVASDVSFDFLCVARRWPGARQIVYVVADARRLPFARAAFHVVTSSLALHHLLPDEAREMLSEARRCVTAGVVVNDIVRGWLGYYGAFVASRLGSRNALTWHDGPLSVLRAYTTQEMAALAGKVGLRPVRWDSFLFYRVALTAVPEERSMKHQERKQWHRVPSQPGSASEGRSALAAEPAA
jgi:ubiquinone/menaquinone biosynthesis C-methylase UbiE